MGRAAVFNVCLPDSSITLTITEGAVWQTLDCKTYNELRHMCFKGLNIYSEITSLIANMMYGVPGSRLKFACKTLIEEVTIVTMS